MGLDRYSRRISADDKTVWLTSGIPKLEFSCNLLRLKEDRLALGERLAQDVDLRRGEESGGRLTHHASIPRLSTSLKCKSRVITVRSC